MMASKVLLPDVNVLVAAHIAGHVHHDLALAWLRAADRFATCATTEQGLVRILCNPVANPGASVADALDALARVRRRRQHEFWAEGASLDDPVVDITRIVGHRQITGFHLLNLAASMGGIMVTLDRGIQAALRPEDRASLLTLGPPGISP